MTDDTIKVKDLATELGVSTKDLLRVLRELDIPAKSTMSPVPPDDLPRLKAHFHAAPADGAQRREVQPGGVIVRRKRVHVDEAPADAVATDTESAPSAHAAKPAASDSGKTASAAQGAEAKEQGSVPATAVVSDTTAANGQVEAPSVKSADVATETAPSGTAETVAERKNSGGQPKTQDEKRTRKRAAPRSEPVAAKVISRPGTPGALDAPANETAAQTPVAAVAETVVVPTTNAVVHEAVAHDAAATPSASTLSADEAKAPVETKTEEAAPLSEADSAKAKADQAAKAARRGQAAASARPEGSSAPSLLPPVSENRTSEPRGEGEDDDRSRRRGRRPQEIASPQVRIISRPDPSATPPPAPRPAADGNYRDGQSRDGNRPGGYTPGGYRGAGAGAPHPGGPRPGGYTPGGFTPGANRPGPGGPGGPGAPRFTPGAPPMPGALPGGPENHEGQSKKKRNKGRKTNDFAQGDVNTFGKRRDDDDSDMPRSRGRRRAKQRQAPTVTQPLKAAKRKIRVEEAIRVADMAHQMGLKSSEIIKVLFNLGIMATINKALDLDTATVVAAEFGYEVEKSGFAEEDYLVTTTADAPENMKLRPPVVTIMGHVDHGKTSLLDAIRKTNVTGGEAGGITQHIGAYHVSTRSGEIVFLDTPGHEAFTAMRARGAQVTDLVVLVVAADDGVMEQTREAVNHSKAAGVPIMVAVNKIDKIEANPDRVLRELADIGLVPEDWGGDTVVSKVSAKSREGLDELLELLALQADILELKANPDKPARGHIVEAKLDKGRGPVATVLIQEGTLHQGDTFVCGVFSGKVRAMFNDQGRKVKEAGPSIPVEVQGFEGVPEAGEEFICLTDEKLARRIAESRAVKQRERELAKESKVTLETFLARNPDDQEAQTLNLVVKADVQGSQEAIVEALNKQSTDKVRIQVIHGGTGAITESDILLASASDAIIIGFNVRPTAKVKEMAEHENVDIRFYDIIYKLVDEIKSAMAGLLAPVSREVYLGQANVREVFTVPKIGAVAGSHVEDGKLLRNAGVRLLRDGVVVYTGKIASLRRFKDDVKEVIKGYECGIGLENYNDIKVGDVIEAFEIVEEAATL